MRNKEIALLVYSLTLAGALAWLVIIFLAPYLRSRSPGLSLFAYAIFSPFCHQIPSRSFFLFGFPIAVCGRCLGTYFGFLGGIVLFPLVKGLLNFSLPKARTFVLFSLPIGLDFLGNLFHLWKSSNWIRFATGFIWGIILPFYFIAGLTDCFVRTKRNGFRIKKAIF